MRVSILSGIVEAYESRLAYIDSHPDEFRLAGLYAAAIGRFGDLDLSSPTGASISSTRIALSYRSEATTFQLTVTGSGIGPVSSADQLLNAIETGLARGTLTRVALSRNGTEILSLGLTDTGYRIASGPDQIRITGSVPNTFAEIYDLADLLGQAQVETLSSMTATARSAYFNALADYGITGLSVGTGGHEIMGFEVTATRFTLDVAGFTLNASGTFPTDFGQLASTLYRIATRISDDGLPDLSGLAHFDIDHLVLRGPDGTALFDVTGPLDTDPRLVVDGITLPLGADVFLHVTEAQGTAGSDAIFGTGAGVNPAGDALYGAGGRDLLFGYGAGDRLSGGQGNDMLHGGAGADLLTGGLGQDAFVFDTALGRGIDRITDFHAIDDTIQLENRIFRALTEGTLQAGAFAANTSGRAGDASDRIIYERDTGALWYDADGTGGAARVQFATLSAGLSLTAQDFLVI